MSREAGEPTYEISCRRISGDGQSPPQAFVLLMPHSAIVAAGLLGGSTLAEKLEARILERVARAFEALRDGDDDTIARGVGSFIAAELSAVARREGAGEENLRGWACDHCGGTRNPEVACYCAYNPRVAQPHPEPAPEPIEVGQVWCQWNNTMLVFGWWVGRVTRTENDSAFIHLEHVCDVTRTLSESADELRERWRRLPDIYHREAE